MIHQAPSCEVFLIPRNAVVKIIHENYKGARIEILSAESPKGYE
jgi:hypothetical protein